MKRIEKKKFEQKIDKLIRVLKKEYKPDKIILYGSCARGDYHEGSDLDLVIIKDDVPDNFLKRLDEVLNLCDGSVGVEALVYKNAEVEKMLKNGNDFIRTVIEEGKVVYEK